MTTAATPYELVIFDMDGTLIDSEHLAELVMAKATEQLTKPMTLGEVTALFRGRTVDYTLEVLAEREGQPLSEQFLTDLNQSYIAAVQTGLQASQGAYDVVKGLQERLPLCVASNSDSASIEFCLKAAGLDEFFTGHMYSAYQVPAPKPAPDLFLFAAQQMGVDPSRCLVVEDSRLGLQAARAAGMDAVGYCGNDVANCAEIDSMGFPVIERFEELVAFLPQQ